MSIVTKSRPAAALTLTEDVQIVPAADNANAPCILTISGASDFQLRLFNVTATGFITPNQAGRLSLVLFGLPNAPNMPKPGLDPTQWVAMATTPGEPVGRPQDPLSTQWMLQGTRMMFYLASGKMQGETSSNIADNPVPAQNLDNTQLGLVKNLDPVCLFAIGASFAPEVDPITAPAPLVQLVHFELTDGA
jgi:hypothetical protein